MLYLLARYPLLSSPRTLSTLAAVAALAAALLLGPDGAEAGKNVDRMIIAGNPRR